MNRDDLRRMIQQEIYRVEEDLLVRPEDIPDDFRRQVALSSDEEECETCMQNPGDCASHGSSYNFTPQDNMQSKMSLSCSTCGGPLVMEGGCGCGGSSVEYEDYEPEMVHSFESPENHQKSGAYMAKAQLHKIKEYVEKMQHMIPDGHDLDDWMRSHISQAADDISEVYHKLDYTYSRD
jgi:hypothetical protein